METEIWFNLIHACHQNEIPLLLLNARLSAKSAKGYQRLSSLTHRALNELSSIAAQTNEDAQRLTKLSGRQISVMGNLKYEIVPPPAMLQLVQQLREMFGKNRPIFLAASTRDGEEELILAALATLNIPNLLLVLVPRHPQRFDAVAKLVEQHKFTLQKRSENQIVLPQTQVVLGDSMGEMFAYYSACDIAFIGGSLLPFGGQNLIEASAVGRPVLIGPHTYNFEQATALAIAADAALRIDNSAQLATTLNALFIDPARMAKMGSAGLQFVKNNTGATERALQLVQRNINAKLN